MNKIIFTSTFPFSSIILSAFESRFIKMYIVTRQLCGPLGKLIIFRLELEVGYTTYFVGTMLNSESAHTRPSLVHSKHLVMTEEESYHLLGVALDPRKFCQLDTD